MYQLSKDEAIEFGGSDKWKRWSLDSLAIFQLHQEKMCIPFGLFHEACERLLGRPVYTHEFASSENLIKELVGLKESPSVKESIADLCQKLNKKEEK